MQFRNGGRRLWEHGGIVAVQLNVGKGALLWSGKPDCGGPSAKQSRLENGMLPRHVQAHLLPTVRMHAKAESVAQGSGFAHCLAVLSSICRHGMRICCDSVTVCR